MLLTSVVFPGKSKASRGFINLSLQGPTVGIQGKNAMCRGRLSGEGRICPGQSIMSPEVEPGGSSLIRV